MSHETIDTISAIAAITSTLVGGAWFVIGLKVKNAMLTVTSLIENVRGKLEAHIGIDDVKHGVIDGRLDRLEKR